MGFHIEKTYVFVCDDCRGSAKFIDVSAARNSGWAISKDRSKCYCRNCGECRRNVGRNGGKKIATIKAEIVSVSPTITEKIRRFFIVNDYRCFFDPDFVGYGYRVLPQNIAEQLDKWLDSEHDEFFNGLDEEKIKKTLDPLERKKFAQRMKELANERKKKR